MDATWGAAWKWQLPWRCPLCSSHSEWELISLLLHCPLPGWGSSHHPKAERGAPEGSNGPARNDRASVNNLLLPRASGSEARTEHNGFLELKGPGRGASAGSRKAAALNPATRVSCLALLYPSSLRKCQTPPTSETGGQKRKGTVTASICKPTHGGLFYEMWRATQLPTPRDKFTLKQDEKKTPSEDLLLPPSLPCPLPSSELDTCPPLLLCMPVTALLLPASSWGAGEQAILGRWHPCPWLVLQSHWMDEEEMTELRFLLELSPH